MTSRGLGKTYANGVTALADVDPRLEYGEILALLGRNGAIRRFAAAVQAA